MHDMAPHPMAKAKDEQETSSEIQERHSEQGRIGGGQVELERSGVRLGHRGGEDRGVSDVIEMGIIYLTPETG